MMYYRHLKGSILDQQCLGAFDNKISLISASPLCCHDIGVLPEHVDGRIALLSMFEMVVYADYYQGIKAISFDGKVLWTLGEKKLTKLRVSQDGQGIIGCRNDLPEVILMNPINGKVMERIKGVTDGIFESFSGARALLNLRDDLVLSASGKSSEVKWGQFALFDGFFRCGRLYVSGTGQSLGIYDIETMSLMSFKQSPSFVRCNPLAWNEARQELTGLVFEYEGEPVTSLVSFDEKLEVKTVIATTALVWGGTIFARGERLFTSNGKLFDTSTGHVIDELENVL